MKKILTTLVIAMALLVTISSCKKDDKQVGESMFGTYTGTILDSLRIDFAPVVTIDTMFTTPGVPATGTLASTSYEDSLSLNVKLEVNGTPIDITVLGHIDSENTFSVPTTIYSYLSAVDIKVSGSGTVNGNEAKVNVKLSAKDGSTDKIYGDLNFTGTK